MYDNDGKISIDQLTHFHWFGRSLISSLAFHLTNVVWTGIHLYKTTNLTFTILMWFEIFNYTVTQSGAFLFGNIVKESSQYIDRDRNIGILGNLFTYSLLGIVPPTLTQRTLCTIFTSNNIAGFKLLKQLPVKATLTCRDSTFFNITVLLHRQMMKKVMPTTAMSRHLF